jgi:hypothetical protein
VLPSYDNLPEREILNPRTPAAQEALASFPPLNVHHPRVNRPDRYFPPADLPGVAAPRRMSILCYGKGFTLWHYRHAGPFAEVLAPGFFDVLAIGGEHETLETGDVLIVSARDGVGQRAVTLDGARVVLRGML